MTEPSSAMRATESQGSILSTTSTSLASARASDVQLRETSVTRLVFRPEIIDNPNNPKACVKGQFIHQRKANGRDWEDCETFSLTTLKAGQAVNLHLDTDSVLRLMEGLAICQRVYEEESGVPLGEKTFVVVPGEEAVRISELLEQPGVMQAVLSERGPVLFGKLAALWKAAPSIVEIVESLAGMSQADLERVVEIARATELVTVLRVWNENRENSQEEFWQRQLTEHSWVLAQVFATAMVIVDAKSYVGGKNYLNTMGQIADFLYTKKLTQNVAIVEIKTPTTPLVEAREYREGVHAISDQLSGSIVQVLQQRKNLERNFYALTHGESDPFEALNPTCVVVAGQVASLNREQIQSLELVRGELANVQVVTFDELFARVEAMLELLGVHIDDEEEPPF